MRANPQKHGEIIMSIDGPRPAEPGEISDIVRLADAVFRVDRTSSMAEDYPLLYAEKNAPDLRIFVSDGQPVSLVGMVQHDLHLMGMVHRCCEIGSVCTHPDFRGQGLATRLLKDARRKAVRDGCALALISGGRGLYRRQGYVDVGGYLLITADASRRTEPVSVSIRLWREEDLPVLGELHAAESVRFVRPPEDWRALLGAERTINEKAETHIVFSKDGSPLAYLACRVPGSGSLADDEVRIDEMGGCRRAVVQALSLLADHYGVRRVSLECLASDREMIHAAGDLGWSIERTGFHGTVGMIDPAGFWRSCRGYVHERLGRISEDLQLRGKGEGAEIIFGEERLALPGMQDLTRLVFLPEWRRDELQLDLPPEGELRPILQRLFPLPLVSYGLNYV